MQESLGDGPDDDPSAERALGVERTWVHPSELGLEHRKRTDRRRGMWLGVGLVVGGFGLLAVFVAMGIGSDPPAVSTSASPQDAVATTLASLTVVGADGRHTATGVVLDDDGHVVVRSSALRGSTEVWASCAGRQPIRVEVVAEDADLAIVAMGEGSGRAATADPDVDVGDEVLIATAGTGEAAPVLQRALVTRAPGKPAASGTGSANSAAPLIAVAALGPTASTQLASKRGDSAGELPADGAAFDDRGRFVGLVLGGGADRSELLPAEVVLTSALALLP